MNLFYDFHIHSCLSPCADNDMTPYNLVNMAKLAGLDMIALTDHNSCLNCPAAIEAGKRASITVIPGMELCTSEEVHIICLLPDLASATAFSNYVYERLPRIANRADIFGDQLVITPLDTVSENYPQMLAFASALSISRVVEAVSSFGGICYPAHIDRPSNSVISNLGGITPEMGFHAAEITQKAEPADYIARYPILKKMFLVTSSDSHRLEDIGRVHHSINLIRNDTESAIDFFNKFLGKNSQS